MTQTWEPLITKIDKLNGENYVDWRFAMQMVFRRADLWKIVSSETAKKDYSDYDKKADEALTVIGLCVEPSQYTHISTTADGVEAWKALEGIYQKNSRANRIALKRQLYTYRHDPGQPIRKYIDGVLKTKGQLRAIGVTISDEDIVDILVLNLDESWSGLASTLATTLTETATVDKVKGALLDEGSRRGEGNQEGSRDPDMAMVARGVRGSRGTRRAMNQRTCYNCGQPGHISRFCNGKKQHTSNANMARDEEEEFDIAY